MYTTIILMGAAYITAVMATGMFLTLLAGIYVDRKIDERIAEENDN